MFRVLVPGGRIGITDVVAEGHLTAVGRAAAGSYVGCIVGALSRTEYLDGLAAAGFTKVPKPVTNQVTTTPGIVDCQNNDHGAGFCDPHLDNLASRAQAAQLTDPAAA